MAIARVKTWSAGEVLTASDLNSEFNNLINNPVDLWSPAGKAADFNGFEVILDADADTSITADTDDRVDLRLGGVDLFVFDGTVASPVNGVTMTAVATGSGPTIAATGSDTNIPLTVKGKGTGKVVLGQATSTEVQLAADQPLTDASGNELVKFAKAASAVNEVTMGNAATGNPPTFSATGGDTNIALRLTPKGTGRLQVTDGSDTTKIVSINVSGVTTGNNRIITVRDADVTIGLQITAGTVLTKNPYATTTTTTQAHGLASAPDLLKARLTCLTGEGGYSAGDVLDLSTSAIVDTNATNYAGFSVQVNATNVALVIGDQTPYVVNKSTGAAFQITAANWRVDITPYAFA